MSCTCMHAGTPEGMLDGASDADPNGAVEGDARNMHADQYAGPDSSVSTYLRFKRRACLSRWLQVSMSTDSQRFVAEPSKSVVNVAAALQLMTCHLHGLLASSDGLRRRHISANTFKVAADMTEVARKTHYAFWSCACFKMRKSGCQLAWCVISQHNGCPGACWAAREDGSAEPDHVYAAHSTLAGGGVYTPCCRSGRAGGRRGSAEADPQGMALNPLPDPACPICRRAACSGCKMRPSLALHKLPLFGKAWS